MLQLLIIKIDIVDIHGKNGFTKISKNLNKYRSENNFVLCQIIL